MKKLDSEEITTALVHLQGWTYEDDYISKSFEFTDFKTAFSVMTRIAFECEARNHHPNWENVYNRLGIKLSTHDVGGVTQFDIDLAERIEEIIQNT